MAHTVSWLVNRIAEWRGYYDVREKELKTKAMSGRRRAKHINKMNDMLKDMKGWKAELKSLSPSAARKILLPGEKAQLSPTQVKINDLKAKFKRDKSEHDKLRRQDPSKLSKLRKKDRIKTMDRLYKDLNNYKNELKKLNADSGIIMPVSVTKAQREAAKPAPLPVKSKPVIIDDFLPEVQPSKSQTKDIYGQAQIPQQTKGNYIGNISYIIKKSIGKDEITFKIPITNKSGKFTARFYYVDLRNAAGTFIDKEPDLPKILSKNGQYTVTMNSALKPWNVNHVQGQNVKFILRESWNNVVGFKDVETKTIYIKPYSETGVYVKPDVTTEKYGLPVKMPVVTPTKIFDTTKQAFISMKSKYNYARDLMDQVNEESKHSKLQADKIKVNVLKTGWKAIQTYYRTVESFYSGVKKALGLNGIIDDNINKAKNAIKKLVKMITNLINDIKAWFKNLLSRLDSKFAEMRKLYYQADERVKKLNMDINAKNKEKIRKINLKWISIKTSGKGILYINSQYKTVKEQFSNKNINGVGGLGLAIGIPILVVLGLVVAMILILTSFIKSMKGLDVKKAEITQDQPIIDNVNDMFDQAEQLEVEAAKLDETDPDQAAKLREQAAKLREQGTQVLQTTKPAAGIPGTDDGKIFGFIEKKDLAMVAVGLVIVMSAPMILKAGISGFSKSMEPEE